MRRHLIGAISLTGLLAGAALQFAGGDSARLEWASACLRVGAVLGALWLALPQLRRPGNRWLVGGILTAFMVLALRPRLFWIAAILATVAFVLRPRAARSPREHTTHYETQRR